MTYSLIETALFLALAVTAWKVTRMHRELKRLRRYEVEFAQMSSQMYDAFDSISASVHDLNANGTQLAHLLGARIDEARGLINEIEALRKERPRAL